MSTRRERRNDDDAPTPIPGASRAPGIAALAALGLLTAGVVGYAVLGGSEPELPPEPEPVALPTPIAPLTRALAPRGDGSGWTWLNPRPRAMPTWYDVDVAGPEEVVLVGQDGAAARFLSGLLVTWRTGTTSSLRDVAWIADDEALAAGDGGTIVRLTMQGPVAIDSGTSVDLRAIAKVGPQEAFVAGDGGTLLRVRGDAVSSLETGTQAGLTAAHVRGGVLWVAGERGTVLRFENNARTTESIGLAVTLRAIGGCESGDLYAAGDQATLVRRRANGTWQNVRTSLDTGESLTAITCDRGRAAIVGSRGSVLLASGTDVVQLPSGFERAWHGVAGSGDDATWLAGAGGRLATIEADEARGGVYVRTATSGPTVPLRDVGTIGGALVAVGEWGRIVRERESGFEESESPTDAGLAAVTAIDEARLLAVGDLGAIVEVRWDGAELVPSPTDASLRDVLVGSDGRVLIVGTTGTLLRGTVSALSASRVPDVGDLWALEGTPDDAIAVGDGGTVLRVRATGTARIPCGERVSLRDVVRTPAGTFAVGEASTIVRITETGCVREHGGESGAPTLESIALGPDGRPLAVGERSTALARTPDGTWEPVALDLGGNHARKIERLGRHVYVVGTGGVVTRHVIADGS